MQRIFHSIHIPYPRIAVTVYPVRQQELRKRSLPSRSASRTFIRRECDHALLAERKGSGMRMAMRVHLYFNHRAHHMDARSRSDGTEAAGSPQLDYGCRAGQIYRQQRHLHRAKAVTPGRAKDR